MKETDLKPLKNSALFQDAESGSVDSVDSCIDSPVHNFCFSICTCRMVLSRSRTVEDTMKWNLPRNVSDISF